MNVVATLSGGALTVVSRDVVWGSCANGHETGGSSSWVRSLG